MENKLTIGSLAASMAQATGKSRKACEDFSKEFFRLVGEAMEDGEPLRIKGFGTFKVVDVESRTGVNVNTGERQEIAPHKKVVFTPSKELAAAINAPFEEFQSVEIDEDMPEDILDGDLPKDDLIPQENIINENLVSDERLEEGSDEEGADDEITLEAYDTIEKEKETEEQEHFVTKEPEKTLFSENLQAANSSDHTPMNVALVETEEPHPHETPAYYSEPSKSRFKSGFLFGALCSLLVCVIIFMLGCFFDWWPENLGNYTRLKADTEMATVSPVVDEGANEENTSEGEPAEEIPPVYDTVSTTRYLTTIAREHYGDFNFWPYIYLENESILGHPDRITPGTRVVVPPLEKYGVSTQNKEDVAAAKKKAQEIYARFK